jgi:hypothetical protein
VSLVRSHISGFGDGFHEIGGASLSVLTICVSGRESEDVLVHREAASVILSISSQS